MTELFGLGLFALGLGLFGSVFGLRLIMPRVNSGFPTLDGCLMIFGGLMAYDSKRC